MLVSGNFSTFDGQPVGYITRLNEDGTIDEDFKTGSGANYYIHSATYNEHLEKYVITGKFKSFDGSPAVGIAVLNKDGTLDPAFQARRSEEHTSELQSLMRISYAVFCLKKKKKKQPE